jgi:hypothetical protein
MSTAGTADLPLEIFSGLVTDIAPSDLPPGASPFNQDVQFILGGWRTRPGLGNGVITVAGNPTINYQKTFTDNTRNKRFLFLDSAGTMHQEFPQGTVTDGINAMPIPAGSYAKSATSYGREYLAISDGQFGVSDPAQWNGTQWDRVSQVGPGAAPTAVDGAAGSIPAGVHKVSVFFVTRSGYFTKLAPFGTWTAGGSKKVNLTNIPVGPPNIVQRIVCFSTAGGADFFYMTGTTVGVLANGVCVINDNTTTTLTVDFTDTILAAGLKVTYLQNILPQLEEHAGVVAYATRLFWWGGRNLVPNFINLPFDGGFAGTPTSSNSVALSPAAAVNDAIIGGTVWNNPSFVLAADGLVASSVITAAAFNSQYIKATGYITGVPANARITGIIVQALVRGSNGTDLSDNSVRLYQNGVLVGLDHANGNTWTTILANQTYGSSSDAWGVTFAPGDAIGVAYSAANNTGGTGSRTAFVDYISLQVFWTVPVGATLPLGWTAGASSAGGASALSGMYPTVWGEAYAITGDGVTAKRGEINQSAYQDYLNNIILQPNTAYGVRAWVASGFGPLTQGTLHVNLTSASGGFTTPGLAVQAAQAASVSYKIFTAAILTSALSVVPSDLLLQVYVDGTPNNMGVFLIDSIEIYPLNQPYLNTTMRASLAGQPETYDQTTGILQPFFQDGGTIRCGYVLREKLYIQKDDKWYETADDGANEPSSWKITQVSGAVGAAGPFATDVGEDWSITANRSGPYIFYGGEPIKIGQEIQSDASLSGKICWTSINWQFGYTIWTLIDKVNKRVLIGAPVNGATSPNVVFYFDYRGMDNAENIADHWSVKYSTYSGKILAIGNAPKWGLWNIFSKSAALIERLDGTAHVFIGAGSQSPAGGAPSGKVYDLLDANKSDDGVGIPWSYTTYYAPSHVDEQTLQIKSHRKLFAYLAGSARGVGKMSISAQPMGNITPTALQALQLVDPSVSAAITAISRINSVVTVTCAAGHGLTAGIDQQAIVQNAADASFNGTAPILSVINPTQFSYYQALPDLILGAGGTVTRLWREFEYSTNVISERVAWTFANSGNAAGSWAQMEKIIWSVVPDPFAPVRGSVY